MDLPLSVVQVRKVEAPLWIALEIVRLRAISPWVMSFATSTSSHLRGSSQMRSLTCCIPDRLSIPAYVVPMPGRSSTLVNKSIILDHIAVWGFWVIAAAAAVRWGIGEGYGINQN